MKIRIKGNSVRYRLTQSDVARLYETSHLEEQTEFMDNTLVYAIDAAGGDQIAAGYTGNRITIYMPKQMIDELFHTERVGFEGKSGIVSLLIEKDFVCLDNTVEDQSDNYPHPTVCNQ